MSSLTATNAPAGPPPIIRRNNDGGPSTTNSNNNNAPPGIPESSSNLSEPHLTTVPSHDNSSSHSGSESRGVERMNPFEQIILTTGSNSSTTAPLEQIASHHSASPDRNTAPSSPQVANTAATPRVPSRSPQQSLPLMPLENATNTTRVAPQMPMEEDDYTHSSSAVNSTEPASSYTPSTDSRQTPGMAGQLVRFLEITRKRISVNSRNNSDEDLIEDLDGMIIGGYLQKLGRNGKWQTRWFESDGECLSYYKNENRTKLLATLDLEKVGTIGLDPADDTECAFTIQVLGRLYHLRAENKVSCTDWVITLNRIKEARMHQGNVKLVGYQEQQHHHHQPRRVDLLDQPENVVAPRVVVVSNRHRTRAVAETQDFDQIMRDNGAEANQLEGVGGSGRRLSTIGTVVLARWNKRRSSLSRLRSKLSKWARSLRNLSCTSDANVGLDNHVHPPGHDDTRKKKHVGWIGKETSAAAPDAAVTQSDEDNMRARKMSSASEEIRFLS